MKLPPIYSTVFDYFISCDLLTCILLSSRELASDASNYMTVAGKMALHMKRGVNYSTAYVLYVGAMKREKRGVAQKNIIIMV